MHAVHAATRSARTRHRDRHRRQLPPAVPGLLPRSCADRPMPRLSRSLLPVVLLHGAVPHVRAGEWTCAAICDRHGSNGTAPQTACLQSAMDEVSRSVAVCWFCIHFGDTVIPIATPPDCLAGEIHVLLTVPRQSTRGRSCRPRAARWRVPYGFAGDSNTHDAAVACWDDTARLDRPGRLSARRGSARLRRAAGLLLQRLAEVQLQWEGPRRTFSALIHSHATAQLCMEFCNVLTLLIKVLISWSRSLRATQCATARC